MPVSVPAPETDLRAGLRSAIRRDWRLVYLGVACCVAIAAALILVAVGVL